MLKPVYAFYLTIIFFLLFTLQACKQQAKDAHAGNKQYLVDSLQINQLIITGRSLQNGNMDSLLQIAGQLYHISNSQHNQKGIIYSEIFQAQYYLLSTDYPHAMEKALQALANAEKWGITKPIPGIHVIMANIHKENGNYPDAFNDCLKGLNQAKANRDTANIIALMGLRAMFIHGYYRKNHRPQDDHNSLNLELEALKMAESNPKYEKIRIKFYNNIAQSYKELKAYDKTLYYGNKAVELARKYNQAFSLTYSYNWLGEAYYYMGDHDKGLAYLNNALKITHERNLPYRQMEIYDAMYWCYLSVKNYEPAIACLNRFTQLRDSLQIAKNEKQVTELQLKYESGKKDKQITSLGEQNTRKGRKIVWTLISMTLFIVLLVIILYQNYIISKNSKLIKTNNKVLNAALLKIAHIQSHQIRKPLASIMGLMNIIKAHDYQADKEVLQKMDKAAHDLDKRIRAVIKESEAGE